MSWNKKYHDSAITQSRHRQKKINDKIPLSSKLMNFIFSGMLLTYVGFQLLSLASDPYQTITALEYLEYTMINTRGFFVREEYPLEPISGGTVSFLREDGEKVSKGQAIAELYSDASSVQNKNLIEKLENQIMLLRKSSDPGALYSNNNDGISRSIDVCISNVADSLINGNVADTENEKPNLIMLMNRRQIATGEVYDFNTKITSLETEASRLRASLNVPADIVYSPQSGIFTSVTDGYENEITPASLNEMTLSQIIEFAQKDIAPEIRQNTVGKITPDFKWRFVALVDSESINKFYVGRTMTLNFTFSTSIKVPVYIERTVYDEKSDKLAIVFVGDYINKELSGVRTGDASIIANTVRGIKVPLEAIRFVDDVMGVYINYGDDVQFRMIDKIYETDKYLLSRIYSQEEKRYLQQFDEIIIGGSGLVEKKSN